jgi:hypothetical protein
MHSQSKGIGSIIRYWWGFRAVLLLWNSKQPRLFSLHDIIA